jgi:hypothetical protein
VRIAATIAETDVSETSDSVRWFVTLRALVADAGFLDQTRVNENEADFGPRSQLERTVDRLSTRTGAEPCGDSSHVAGMAGRLMTSDEECRDDRV